MTEPRKPGRPPERITVTVHFKMALSTPAEVQTVLWPKNWPIPEQGDQVFVGGNSGIVNNRSFVFSDDEAPSLNIHCR